MKENGGYAIIDGFGIDISDTENSVTVSGLHARIASIIKTKKNAYLYNTNNDGDYVSPIAVSITTDSTSYVLKCDTLVITVTNADAVTVEDVFGGGDTPEPTSPFTFVELPINMFSDLTQTVPTLYADLVGAATSGKPICFYNMYISMDEEERIDISPVTAPIFSAVASTYTILAMGYTITVTSDGSVTITSD